MVPECNYEFSSARRSNVFPQVKPNIAALDDPNYAERGTVGGLLGRVRTGRSRPSGRNCRALADRF